MLGMRALVLAAAATIVLSGCSNASAPRTPPNPLRPITATFLNSHGAPSVTAVQFLDPLHGWIGVTDTPYSKGQKGLSGGVLLRTVDGGHRWKVMARTKFPILAIDFASPQNGFVLAGGEWVGIPQFTLYRGTDGGGPLQELSHPRPDAGVAVMHFSSPTQGFIVSQNTLDVTTDGGRTWQASSAQPRPGFFGGPMSYAPAFLSASTGFTALGNGIMRTTDGGRSWQSVYALPNGNGADGPVTFATPEVGYAAVWVTSTPPPYQFSSVILRTDDGGTSWHVVSGGPPGGTQIGSPPPIGAEVLAAWGKENVAVRVQGRLYISRDGGATWKSVAGSHLDEQIAAGVFTYAPGVGLLADSVDGGLMRLAANDVWQPVWPNRKDSASRANRDSYASCGRRTAAGPGAPSRCRVGAHRQISRLRVPGPAGSCGARARDL